MKKWPRGSAIWICTQPLSSFTGGLLRQGSPFEAFVEKAAPWSGMHRDDSTAAWQQHPKYFPKKKTQTVLKHFLESPVLTFVIPSRTAKKAASSNSFGIWQVFVVFVRSVCLFQTFVGACSLLLHRVSHCFEVVRGAYVQTMRDRTFAAPRLPLCHFSFMKNNRQTQSNTKLGQSQWSNFTHHMPCVQCFPAAFSKPSLISLYHFDCSGSTETFWQWNSAIQNLLVPFMVNLLQLLWPVVGATFTTSLLPVRRCYIRPPEADDGCKLLQNLSSSAFGLNNFGQDTTAQRHCLHYLREAQKDGLLIIYFWQRCDWCSVGLLHSQI